MQLRGIRDMAVCLCCEKQLQEQKQSGLVSSTNTGEGRDFLLDCVRRAMPPGPPEKPAPPAGGAREAGGAGQGQLAWLLAQEAVGWAVWRGKK